MSQPPKRRKIKGNFQSQHHPEKPSAIFESKSTCNKSASLSIALPGSILINAQNEELKAVLASQIARSAAIFGVTEIVVFHEDPPLAALTGQHKGKYRKEEEVDADAYLAKILEYLETPQYLRRSLFPMQPMLRHVGLLPPLDMPHHLRKTDQSRFREGFVQSSDRATSIIDIGLDKPINIMQSVPEHTRVTVDLQEEPRVVSPSTPALEHGTPWGYSVRLASSLSNALMSPDASQPYDLLIGLAERGASIDDLPPPSSFPKFTRALIVLGGLSGLELSIEKEKDILGVAAEESHLLFDYWVNICPGQASRTIRTEEALTIGLSGLRERLKAGGSQ